MQRFASDRSCSFVLVQDFISYVLFEKGSFTINARRTFRFLRFPRPLSPSLSHNAPKMKMFCSAVFCKSQDPLPSTLEKMSARTLIMKDPLWSITCSHLHHSGLTSFRNNARSPDGAGSLTWHAFTHVYSWAESHRFEYPTASQIK